MQEESLKNKSLSITNIATMEDFYNLISWCQRNENLIIFRGQENYDWELESSWVRENNDEKSESKRFILRSHINVFNEYIQSITKNQEYSNRGILDILAELQHAKDVPTPLIDFTDDLLASFWFALSNHKFKGDAAIFLVTIKDRNQIKKEIKLIDETTQHQVFESPYVSKRALSQRSYFIIDSKEWANDESVVKIRVRNSVIEEILKYLFKKNKSYKSVYPDLKGEYLNAVSGSSSEYFLKARLSNDYNHQMKLYDKGLNINPNEPTAINNKGAATLNFANKNKDKKIKLKFLNKAKNLLEKALELNPEHILAIFNHGLVWTRLSELEEDKTEKMHILTLASKDFKKVIKIDDEFVYAYFNLALIYHDLALINEKDKVKVKYYNLAIENYDFSINLKNDYINAIFNKGLILEELSFLCKTKREVNEYSLKALECFQGVLDIDPSHEKALLNKRDLLEIIEYEKTQE